MRKLSTILFLALLSFTTWAYDFQVDQLCYNINDENPTEVEVTYQQLYWSGGGAYLSLSGAIIIPSTVTYYGITYTVTGIGYAAFAYCSSLTSVTISNSVTSIEEYAFVGCSSVTNIQVESGNPSYSSENGVLFNAAKTTLVQYPAGKTETTYTIPSSITSIGDDAFFYCSSLTSVTIPEGVTSIGESAFEGCSSLTSVTIPTSVTSIGRFVFSRCSSLSSVTIPNSVTSIGYDAFAYCSSLTSVYYTGSIAEWCGIDFNDYSSNPVNYACNLYINGNLLTELVIPDGVTEIKNYAFSNCSSLTSVTIPNSVTSIGDCAFRTCSSLTSVTIGSGVTSIGDYAFYICSTLTIINIEAQTPPALGSNCFYDTNLNVIFVPSGTSSAYASVWGSDYLYVDGNGIDLAVHISTPGGLTTAIEEKGYTPAQVNKLTVTGLLNNTDFNIIKNDMNSLIDLNLECIDNTTLPNEAFKNKNRIFNILLPANLTTIPTFAFSGCSLLTSVSIPNSVISIGNCAFHDCSSLTAFTTGNSVTSIGDDAFENCSSLTSVIIGNSVTSIGWSAFLNCSSLTDIQVESGNPSYSSENGVLFSADKTTLVQYPAGKTETTFTIPNSVTSIGDYAFEGSSSLTSVTIPTSVTSIGDYAFADCSSLISVTIPNSVISIGYLAFYDCSSLASVTISNSVTSIGWSAFLNCSSLTDIQVESGNPSYSSENGVLFSADKTTLVKYPVAKTESTYTIPNSVTSIESNAFEYCFSLTSITIGNGVESIYYDAFSCCFSLDTIICLGGNPPVVYLEFSTIDPSTCKLYVPQYALIDYIQAPVWSDFLNIEGIEVDYTLSLTISDGCKIVYQDKEYTETTEISVAGGSDMTFKIPQYESYTNLSVRYNGIEYVSEMDEDGNLTLPTMKGDGKLEITNNATDIIFPTLSHLRAWQAHGTIFAEVDDNVATLQLYDVSGRLMNEHRHNGNYQVITLPAPDEVNILKVVGKDGSITAHKLM